MGILMVGMVNPEIDRRISKKWKKTKLPGKTSWKVSIWHFILYECLFLGKIQFATLSKIQITILTVLNYSQESLVAFFFTKIFRNGLHTILSVGFRIFWFKIADSPKNDFISSFFSFVLVFLCQPRASFYRSAIFSALLQKRTNKYVTNPFWGSGRKLTR